MVDNENKALAIHHHDDNYDDLNDKQDYYNRTDSPFEEEIFTTPGNIYW